MINIFISFLFLVYPQITGGCIGTVKSRSESPENVQFEKKLKAAVEHLYQTRWEEAGAALSELKQNSPDDPRTYFLESLILFWEYFFVHQKSELADLYLEQSEIAV